VHLLGKRAARLRSRAGANGVVKVFVEVDHVFWGQHGIDNRWCCGEGVGSTKTLRWWGRDRSTLGGGDGSVDEWRSAVWSPICFDAREARLVPSRGGVMCRISSVRMRYPCGDPRVLVARWTVGIGGEKNELTCLWVDW